MIFLFSIRTLTYCFVFLTQNDAGKALELDPQNAAVKKSFARLQKIENERLEKLKEETMGKLKDLGNSLLS